MQNKYNDESFFSKYSQMNRSQKGLEAAGEWSTLQKMLPEFKEKRILDLGCGFGFHCLYAVEQGAKSVIGIDLSAKMLAVAKEKTKSEKVTYIQMSIEDIDFEENSFDIVISSLAFHYVKSFKDICLKVSKCLSSGGAFVFSAEHPIFTAEGTQDWCYDAHKNKIHWPVDKYFDQSSRNTSFLGEEVVKRHKTLTTYVNTYAGNRI